MTLQEKTGRGVTIRPIAVFLLLLGRKNSLFRPSLN